MTPTRSLLMVSVAVALLIGARPIAGDEQFPRGLMSAEPRGGGQGGSCTIQTRPLAFGAYDPLAETTVDAVAQIIYFCTQGSGGGGGDGGSGGPPPGRGGGPGTRAQNIGIRIEMDMGTGTSNENRELFGLTDHLAYNIYLDATHLTVWGDGSAGTDFYVNASPPLGTPVTVLAYGRIFRGQDATAGDYRDSVQVRIQF